MTGGVFPLPGDQGMDFSPLFRALEDAGYQGWMVVEAEQEQAKADPREYASKAREYVREATGL